MDGKDRVGGISSAVISCRPTSKLVYRQWLHYDMPTWGCDGAVTFDETGKAVRTLAL